MTTHSFIQNSKALVIGASLLTAVTVSVYAADGAAAVTTSVKTTIAPAVTIQASGTMDTSAMMRANTDAGMETGDESATGAAMMMMTTSAATDVSGGITLPVNIAASADLQTYNENVMQEDDAVAAIDTSSSPSAVTVEYKHKAKLFGFIPVRIGSETTVSASSDNKIRVATKMSWWSFMVSGVKEVAADVDAKLITSATINNSMNATASPQVKALVVHAVVSQHAEVETANQAAVDAE